MGPEDQRRGPLGGLGHGGRPGHPPLGLQFAAADTLATSYVLGMGIRKIGRFDLILSGMRTSDGDTGQVGPQLAEELDIPLVTAVEKVERKEGPVSRGASLRRIQRGPGCICPCPLYYLCRENGAPSESDRNRGCLQQTSDRVAGTRRT